MLETLDSGSVVDAGGAPSDIAMRVRCDYLGCMPAGRRPAQLGLQGGGGTVVGRWLAEVAALEAASAPAFAELRRELRAHGAPLSLVRATRRAEADEVRHARDVAGLTRLAGTRPDRAIVLPAREARPLAELVAHNAAEGCVRESYGALAAHHQSRHASDARVRQVFATIARDEARHALLSIALDAWARPRLRAVDRRRAEEAEESARFELAACAASQPAELEAALGVPDEDRAHSLLGLVA